MPLAIRVLQSDVDIEAAFELMSTLRSRISRDTFLSEIRLQQRDGYELIGGFVDDVLVALAGFRPAHTLSRGAHFFVDDLVTDAARHGAGHGSAMLEWIAARAREHGAPRVYLDSRDTAREFYAGLGFTFLTSIPCWIESDRL